MAYHARTCETREAANDDDDTMARLRTVVSALVKRQGTDFTARQLGVLLTVYLYRGPHTVRSLSAGVHIHKPAVTRALNKLGDLDLVRRKADPQDRRSVLVQRTAAGWNLLEDLRAATARGGVEDGEPAPGPLVGGRAWLEAVVTHRAGYGHGFAANTAAD